MAVARLHVAQLQPGMTLAQPIIDDKGRTVVPEGGRLTPMTIKRLGQWGVTQVAILDPATAAAQEQERKNESGIMAFSTEQREAMRMIAASVQERFRNQTGKPVMEELKRLTVRHLVMSLPKGELPGIHR